MKTRRTDESAPRASRLALRFTLSLRAVATGPLWLVAACGGGGDAGPVDPPAANREPSVAAAPPPAVRVGALAAADGLLFEVQASDPDGDPLRFSATGLPAWARLDEMSGRFYATPAAADIGRADDIVIAVSDGRSTATLPAFGLDVLPPLLSEGHLVIDGNAVEEPPVAGGARAQRGSGTLQLNPCGFVTELRNAEYRLETQPAGELVELAGVADLPARLSPWVGVSQPVRARFGLLSGAQINNDPAFGIQLQPDTQYLAYRLGVSTTLELGDRRDPGQRRSLSLSLPFGGESVFITDPCDVMVYRYTGSPAGDVGYGESDRGLIPFVPEVPSPDIGRFSGHVLERGRFDVGVKVFDLLSIRGTRVTRQPDFAAVDWSNPLDARTSYRAGINGEADVALGVFGVGVFSFDAAKASLGLEVSPQRQQLAMEMRVAPDVSWQPRWFPILPVTETVGRVEVNGRGEFLARLETRFRSTLPPAEFGGVMQLDNAGASLTAEIPHDTLPLSLTARFAGDTTEVELRTPSLSVAPGVKRAVTQALDRQLARAQQAFTDLERSKADYTFELSLRGLRSGIPDIVDTAQAVLAGVPGEVDSSVASGVTSGFRNACFSGVCVSTFVDETGRGRDHGDTAAGIARDATTAVSDRLGKLKALALSGDDEAFKAGIKTALQEVLDRSKVTVRVPGLGWDVSGAMRTAMRATCLGLCNPPTRFTIYPDTVINRTVLSTDTVNDLQIALNNVDSIQQTSERMFSAQSIFDAIPAAGAINQAREQVDSGLARIPSFDGGGYLLSPTRYEPYILLSGERRGVTFNLLDPVEALAGIGDTIAQALLP